jgi:PAS domain S-box-containing protein
MPLLSRLRIRLVLIVLLPIAAFLGYDTIHQSEMAKRQALQQAADMSQYAIEAQRGALDSIELVSRLISQVPAVRLLAPNACNATLAGVVEENPRYASLAVQDRAGNVLCSSAPMTGPVNVADRLYFKRAMATKSFAVGEYQLGRLTGKPSLGTALPILDDSGAVTRLIYAGLDMIWFSQNVATAGLPEGSAFILLDKKGMIMARWPDPQVWVGRDVSGEPLFRALVEHGPNVDFGAAGLDGVERIYHSFELKPSDEAEPLLAAVGIPAAIARAAAREDLARNLIIALGIGLALATAAVWFAERTISRPIRSLMALARRIGAGDLDARGDIPHASGEIGLLAASFEDMARSLKSHQERLLGQQKLLSTIGTVSRRYNPDGAMRTEHLTALKDVSGVLNIEAERRTDGRRADIIEVTADGIVIADEALTILRFNPAAEKLFGYTAAEVVGRKIDMLLPERARKAHPAQVKAFSRSPMAARMIGQSGAVAGRRKDGTEFPAEASIAKLAVNGGWVFVAVMSDITERKAAGRALEKSEARLRYLIEMTGVIPYILDVSSGRYLYVAPQVKKLLGYSSEDWRDEKFWLAGC